MSSITSKEPQWIKDCQKVRSMHGSSIKIGGSIYLMTVTENDRDGNSKDGHVIVKIANLEEVNYDQH